MRKMRKTGLIISILAGILVLSTIVMFAGNDGSAAVTEVKIESNSKTLTSHAPIYIDGNSGFTKPDPVNGGGTGTASDPYIIENWDINASSATGILIMDTDIHFIIINCVIRDGKSNSNDGVYFIDVVNGKIDNITSYNNYHGIYLHGSSNNSITTSRIHDNSHGILLASPPLENNIISSNQIYNNYWDGIFLHGSLNHEIHYNNIYNNAHYGIHNYNSESEHRVDATYNWWGSTDGPDGIGPGSGDNVSGNVLYDPWLSEPAEGVGWMPPEGEGEEGKPFEIPWLYIIILVIIIVVLAAVGVSISRRKKAPPPEKT